MKKFDLFELMKFCAVGGSGNLSEPFSDNTFTYATNGHMIVRIPRVELITKKNPIPESFNGLIFDPRHKGEWLEIPIYTQFSQVVCPDCQSGKYIEDCCECKGEGEIIFKNRWNSYDVECKTCLGDGILPSAQNITGSRPCTCCEATGKTYKGGEPPSIIVNKTKLNICLLNKIKDLPNIQLFLPPTSPGFVNYKFDGGEGILMKMRNEG